MPSPFPGMNPFLEDTTLFHGFHQLMIVALTDAIGSRLPEPYSVGVGERAWIEMAESHFEPDVNVLREDKPTPKGREKGVVLAELRATAPVVVNVPFNSFRETFLNVYTRRDNEE